MAGDYIPHKDTAFEAWCNNLVNYVLVRVLVAPPSGGKDLPHSVFTRKKKVRFDFDGESGKAVCLRYENQKGGKDGAGPPILKAIIP